MTGNPPKIAVLITELQNKGTDPTLIHLFGELLTYMSSMYGDIITLMENFDRLATVLTEKGLIEDSDIADIVSEIEDWLRDHREGS